MKTKSYLIVTALVFLGSFSHSQINLDGEDLKTNSPCDPGFVFDYRMIYKDTLTPVEIFLNDILLERFHVDAFYLYGDFDDPENLFIGVAHVDHPEWVIENRLCFFEKLSQFKEITMYIEEIYD